MGNHPPYIYMTKTRNGVYYNLEESTYRVEIDNITYVFSSQFHLEKFLKNVESNRKVINTSISNRFKVPIICNYIADLALYKKIENRGFLIIYKGELIKCQTTIKLGGEIKTLKF